MKNIKELIRSNRLAAKIVAMILVVDIVLLLVTTLIMPQLFYAFLKDEAVNRKIVEIEHTGIISELSFLMYMNDRNVKLLDESTTELDFDRAFGTESSSDRHMLEEYVKNKAGFFEGKEYCAITVTNGSEVVGSELYSEMTESLIKQEWYLEYREKDYPSAYQLYSTENNEYIIYVRTVEREQKKYEYFMFLYNEKYARCLFQLEQFGINDFLAYYRESDNIVYATKGIEKTAVNYPQVIEAVKSTEGLGLYAAATDTKSVFSDIDNLLLENKKGYDFVFISSFIENDELTAVMMNLSKELLLENYNYIFVFNRSILIGAFLISAALVFIIISRSMQGIKKMSKVMNQVKEGDFSVSVKLDSHDEIEELGETFNFMIETINEYIETTVQQKKKESEMRYMMLISEIDPHFIYNTLSTVTYLASMKRTADIILVNKALTAILKDRLKIKAQKSFDKISYERDLVNQYMLIQKYLHSDKIVVKWDIPEYLLDCEIPKNILQTLVENSLLHGLLPKKDENGEIKQGNINVSINQNEDGAVYIAVKDTGVGMDEETLHRYFADNIANNEEEGEHIGIKNIKMRLAYLYGAKWEIKVSSRLNEGTEIIIYLPEIKLI